MTEEDTTNQNKEQDDVFQQEDDLQTELEASIARAEEYLDSLQRERASFANYKRRIEQENAQMAEHLLG